MQLRRALLILMVLGGLGATGALIRHEYRVIWNARKVIDDAGMIGPGWTARQEHYLREVMEESGVDIRVRYVHSTGGEPLPEFALAMMREQAIGKDVGGRGLLIVVDDCTKQSRIEVGPHLEGIFPDGFVAYLLRDNLSEDFGPRGPASAIWTTLILIHYRIREARLGGEYDPRVLNYIRDVRSLARGGGASVSIRNANELRHAAAAGSAAAIDAYFTPQPTVQAVYERYLEFLALGLWPRVVPLYTQNSTGLLLLQGPTSRAWNDYILMTEYGYSYEIDQRGDYAMLYYTGTPFQSPLFFRRSARGWQMDFAAEILNSEETIGGYFTWRLRRGRDTTSVIFADRYMQIDGTDFGEFFRVRGGDNRPMCIYGGSLEWGTKSLHALKCLPAWRLPADSK